MKRLNPNNYNFTLNLYNKKGKVVSHVSTHKYRRFYTQLLRADFKKKHSKAYIRINYGNHEDCRGDIVPFINEGDYYTKTKLMQAWRAFLTA
jgi:hypothetical protein